MFKERLQGSESIVLPKETPPYVRQNMGAPGFVLSGSFVCTLEQSVFFTNEHLFMNIVTVPYDV